MREDLLPGVTTEGRPPAVVCDAKAAIRRARRRAFLRDAMQVGLLAAVDFLFVYWPESRVPFLDRRDSLAVLRAMNGLIFAHVWLVRALPKWTARRIASTWCRSEQERFSQPATRQLADA
ncbi:MAG TPA: hypothetical protein VGF48_19790 [Thermoanaerobaculia bacterium]|jgi:hypothetical protein